jgi:hypothetical protein
MIDGAWVGGINSCSNAPEQPTGLGFRAISLIKVLHSSAIRITMLSQ